MVDSGLVGAVLVLVASLAYGANVAAGLGYLLLVGVLSLAAALHARWRIALLASLAVPVLAWWSSRRLTLDAPPPSRVAAGRLPGRSGSPPPCSSA